MGEGVHLEKALSDGGQAERADACMGQWRPPDLRTPERG